MMRNRASVGHREHETALVHGLPTPPERSLNRSRPANIDLPAKLPHKLPTPLHLVSVAVATTISAKLTVTALANRPSLQV